MPRRRSLDYKSSSSSSTWMCRREEGELAAFALPLLGTSVSCAPRLLSHWCGTGPCLLEVWAAWERSVCECVWVSVCACRWKGFEGCACLILNVYLCACVCARVCFNSSTASAARNGPLRLGTGVCTIFKTLLLSLYLLFFLSLPLSSSSPSLPLCGSKILTELMKLRTKA